MRKPRAVIIDDEPVILLLLRDIFSFREYDVVSLSEPVICPVYDDEGACDKDHPCADIMITDNRMPRMNGVDLLETQARNGCRLTSRNKALMSGYLDDAEKARAERLGVHLIEKPVDLDELGTWIDACERRMDLSKPLPLKRREVRRSCRERVQYRLNASASVLSGIAVNMSPSGLCVQMPEVLSRGSVVHIQTSLPLLSHVALVRWTAEAGDGSFLAGLQCN